LVPPLNLTESCEAIFREVERGIIGHETSTVLGPDRP
jgi:hypothetical protein